MPIRTTGDAGQASGRGSPISAARGCSPRRSTRRWRDGRIDFAVHSLKDLETELPPGIVLACTLNREDARDVLILGPECGEADPADPFAPLPAGALVGSSSVRRQAQLLHARPDLRVATIRGNVHTRLDRVRQGEFAASLLALAGLRRLGLEHEASVVIDPDAMVPSAGQGIVGITVRADDTELREMLAGIEDPTARAVVDRRARAAGAARRLLHARRSAGMRACCRTGGCI